MACFFGVVNIIHYVYLVISLKLNFQQPTTAFISCKYAYVSQDLAIQIDGEVYMATAMTSTIYVSVQDTPIIST